GGAAVNGGKSGAALKPRVYEQLGGRPLVKRGGVVKNRRFRIDNDRQRFVIDIYEFDSILRPVTAFGDNAHDGLADVAHLASRQWQNRRGVIVRHTRRGNQWLYRFG